METAAGQNTGGFFGASFWCLRVPEVKDGPRLPNRCSRGTSARNATRDADRTRTSAHNKRLSLATTGSHRRILTRAISAAVAVLLAPGYAVGAVVEGAAGEAAASVSPANPHGDPDYSAYTHHQLTEIGARWEALSDAERRALLKEVKMRMARQRDADGSLQIRTQRRYGRIVRSSDGRVLRIETKVVQVRPAVPRGGNERSFGVGFERRHGPAGSSPESVSDGSAGKDGAAGAPARRVNDRR